MRRPTLTVPFLLRPAATGVAYLAASALALALTRFEGGVAFIWAANAVLLAALTVAERQRWPILIGICWAGGVVAAGWWGLGWRAGPVISALNVAEPLIAAVLIDRWGVRRSELDSAWSLGAFVVAAGVVAPGLTGVLGAIVVSAVSGTPFASNGVHWLVGHALGAITFTPIFVQVASGEMRRRLTVKARGEAIEAVGLLTLLAAVTIGVFAQSRMPMLFLPALPLMLVTFRTGRIGSAAGVAIITLIGGALTLTGRGPVRLIQAPFGEQLQFLQFYLAITVLTVLPAAAELARRHLLFERLRDSEARFRLLTEKSTDIILNIDVDGTIRYVSPSIRLLGGYDPAALIGTASAALVADEDRDQVRATHLRALAQPGETFSVEYRGVIPSGDERWFETRTRAVTDEAGSVSGVVSAVRDTSARRHAEAELSRQAHTDPLTGASNRRAFDLELASRIQYDADRAAGYLALFDLDHFKRINDTYGHAAGDRVLQGFARIAASKTRGEDLFARIGGEEFALVSSAPSLEHAHAVCERIRKAIEADPITVGDWPIRFTVSIGVAPIVAGKDVQVTVRAADEALYRSKLSGRNRSSLAA